MEQKCASFFTYRALIIPSLFVRTALLNKHTHACAHTHIHILPPINEFGKCLELISSCKILNFLQFNSANFLSLFSRLSIKMAREKLALFYLKWYFLDHQLQLLYFRILHFECSS